MEGEVPPVGCLSSNEQNDRKGNGRMSDLEMTSPALLDLRGERLSLGSRVCAPQLSVLITVGEAVGPGGLWPDSSERS